MCSSGGVRRAFWALFFDRRSGAGVEQFGRFGWGWGGGGDVSIILEIGRAHV